MPKSESPDLTTPDLVLLALLTEWPMYGYEANQELERRQVHEWAGVSRPQVYYSLAKLERLGLISEAESETPPAGPDRRVFRTSEQGNAALADALALGAWTEGRDRPKFLTWLALSWRARPGVAEQQVAARQKFLEGQLADKQETLRAIRAEVGHEYHEAVWMVSLVVQQIRVELRWLRKLARELDRRAPAQSPPARRREH